MPDGDMLLCLPSVLLFDTLGEGYEFDIFVFVTLYFCCLLNGRSVLHTFKGYAFDILLTANLLLLAYRNAASRKQKDNAKVDLLETYYI